MNPTPSNRAIRCRHPRLSVFDSLFVGVLLLVANSSLIAAQNPLTTLEYKITGTQLRVTPLVLSVPKGVPGSILVELVSGGSTNAAATSALADGAFIGATLRGPAFPA